MRATMHHGLWAIAIAGAGFLLFCAALASGVAASAILFYRGLVLAALVALAAGAIGGLVARRWRLPPLALAAALASFSVNSCFLVLFPVTIDRSISVYLLATLESSGPGGLTADALRTAFVRGYVDDMGAIERRIDEQVRSGNVHIGADGQVRLTPQGRRFVAISRAAAERLRTDRRFVDGYAPSGTTPKSTAPR